MDTRRPPAEVEVDAPLVRALLEEQCPELAGEPLAQVGEGWDNVTWRVGSGLAARIPRRAAAVPLLVHEQRWLPLLAPRLEVRVPLPVHAGVAGAGFPWPWSVVEWLPGTTADAESLVAGEAGRLAGVLAALHVEAPPEAPTHAPIGVKVLHQLLDGRDG